MDEGLKVYLILGVCLILSLAGIMIYQNIKYFNKKKKQLTETKKQRLKKK